MKIGEIYKNKHCKEAIKLIEFLGSDFWSTRNLIDGSDEDISGDFIHKHYFLITDLKVIQAHERNLHRCQQTIRKFIHHTRKGAKKWNQE